jgi:ATP-dependent RNA helicase DHX29
MSATVNAEKICAYFDDCPFIKVPGRTFPVQVNYLEDAVEMTRYFIGESSPFAIRGT